jgi:hypothetical protein
MQSVIPLEAAHWLYLAGIAVIVLTMLLRANVVVPAMLATFLVALALSGSFITAIGSIFTASFIAAKELFNIFLVIALMTALLNSLRSIRSDVRMVQPLQLVMKNGHIAYVVLAVTTYLISLFFWPTPAVPLVAAVLLPAAILAGMPPMLGAMAIAIVGQGMALSSDYVIGVAPGISAKAAGVAVSASMVADRAMVLSLITGGVALILGYLAMRKYIVPGSPALLTQWQSMAMRGGAVEEVKHSGTFEKAELAHGTDHQAESEDQRVVKWSKVFAIVTPLAFIGVVLVMVLPKMGTGLPDLRGGDAAAMVGGVAALLMILVTLAAVGPRKMLDACPDHVTDGFVFAFKAMGSVLPIAGFFFLGSADTTSQIVGISEAPNLLFELVQAGQGYIPDSKMFVAFGVLLVGMVTGIDGSGFSGLPLTGALSGALGPVVGLDSSVLAAVGQMGAIWTGGGTLIAWSSLIAVAGFARVPVLEVVRNLLLPVLAGLFVATTFAVLVW